MSGNETTTAHTLKERALEELRGFALIALCLWLFLGSFTAYRRLILAETGVAYVHYGVALVEALVIAKVVLLGRIVGFSHHFENRPLIVPVICRSLVFALLVIVFSVMEHVVVGWVRGRRALDGLRELADLFFAKHSPVGADARPT